MKKYTPKLLIKYLIKEFSISLLIFFFVIFSLILLTTFLDEIIYFRDKNIDKVFFLKTLFLALIKTPSLIITMSPFIFLFASIFFFVKLIKNNEIIGINLSGLSHNFISLVPALYSFFLGMFLILVISPFSSQLYKYYESVKQKYSNNDNLIIMSTTGLWLKEKKDNDTFIIRADNIKDQNFKNLKNISIYKFKNNRFLNRIDSKDSIIQKNKWILKNISILRDDNNIQSKDFIYNTNINLESLKEFYSNSYVFSIWNILDDLATIRERGYYGQEIVITLNKYLSLPFFLFTMVILSTFFTIKIKKKFSNFTYSSFGIVAGILIYFLNDLSIAIGKSGKLPLELSIWVPVILIMTLSLYSLIKEYD
jgi:lipopolysaccharide export system permease protein